MAQAEKVQEVAYEVLQGKSNHEEEKGKKAKKGVLARVTAAIKLLVGHLVPLRIKGEEESMIHLEVIWVMAQFVCMDHGVQYSYNIPSYLYIVTSLVSSEGFQKRHGEG